MKVIITAAVKIELDYDHKEDEDFEFDAGADMTLEEQVLDHLKDTLGEHDNMVELINETDSEHLHFDNIKVEVKED